MFKIIVVGKIDKSALKLRTSSHEKTSLRAEVTTYMCTTYITDGLSQNCIIES